MLFNELRKKIHSFFLKIFGFSTIKAEFIVPISLSLVVLFVLLEVSFELYQSRRGKAELQNDIEMITDMEKKFLSVPLWDYDNDRN